MRREGDGSAWVLGQGSPAGRVRRRTAPAALDSARGCAALWMGRDRRVPSRPRSPVAVRCDLGLARPGDGRAPEGSSASSGACPSVHNPEEAAECFFRGRAGRAAVKTTFHRRRPATLWTTAMQTRRSFSTMQICLLAQRQPRNRAVSAPKRMTVARGRGSPRATGRGVSPTCAQDGGGAAFAYGARGLRPTSASPRS